MGKSNDLFGGLHVSDVITAAVAALSEKLTDALTPELPSLRLKAKEPLFLMAKVFAQATMKPMSP